MSCQSLNLDPLVMPWPRVTTGDTFPAMRITETRSDTALVRVRVKVKAQGSDVTNLDLDSDTTGITITTATAGAWDFQIDRIDTVSLAAGWYSYDLESTDDAGTVKTEFKGSWQILPKITD